MSGVATGAKFIFKNPNVKPSWYHIDAKNVVVGRLASQISILLQGKHKPIYDKSELCGDYVVVTNVKDIQFTGKNWQRKIYRWHTGYIGHLKEMPAWRMRERFPDRVLKKAVWGMLPRTALKQKLMTRLKIFPTSEHHLDAQLSQATPLPSWFKLKYYDPKEKKVDPEDPMANVTVTMDDNIFEAKIDKILTPKQIEAQKRKEEYLARPKPLPWYDHPLEVHHAMKELENKVGTVLAPTENQNPPSKQK